MLFTHARPDPQALPVQHGCPEAPQTGTGVAQVPFTQARPPVQVLPAQHASPAPPQVGTVDVAGMHVCTGVPWIVVLTAHTVPDGHDVPPMQVRKHCPSVVPGAPMHAVLASVQADVFVHDTVQSDPPVETFAVVQVEKLHESPGVHDS